MGIKNYLIEGGSGTGKTAVAEELQRRGWHVIHGDRTLAYRGYPDTGDPLNEVDYEKAMSDPEWGQKHWLWDVSKVKAVIDDHSIPVSFFCGGSRNFPRFIDLLDAVFVLEVNDLAILFRRLDERIVRDPTDFGGKPEEKDLIARLHATKEDTPKGDFVIDATAPIELVVNEILEKCELGRRPPVLQPGSPK